MTPKLCTIVSDKLGSSAVMKQLQTKEFVNFISPVEYKDQGEHTLIYGYALAKSMFENISIGDYRITDRIRWTFNEYESKDDVYVEEWINTTLAVFFKHERIDGSYSFDEQFSNIELPFVYNGNHELYLVDAKTSKCYSWHHEEIAYRTNKEPTQFMVDVINWFLSRKLVVYAFNGKNIDLANQSYDNIVLFVQDIIFSETNTWITKESVKSMLKPHKLTTPEFMLYISRIPNIYTHFDSKDYISRFNSSIVEQLFSEAEIHFSVQNLLSEIKKENKAGGNPDQLEKIYSALNNDGNLAIPYLSRNKVTGRLFPLRSVVNPVTVSDSRILESISSRHEDGSIFVFDFKTFEPTILNHVCGLSISNDLHQLASEILDCPRDNAKKLNNMIFYGASSKSIADELNDLNAGSISIERYLTMMLPIIRGISSYRESLENEFEHKGYITTIFGRKVWAKNKSSLLNNAIQTTASEIFNDAALKLFELLNGKQSKLFMHRFDAFYTDIHPNETSVVNEIADVMMNSLGIEFGVSISAGRNLNNLRSL